MTEYTDYVQPDDRPWTSHWTGTGLNISGPLVSTPMWDTETDPYSVLDGLDLEWEATSEGIAAYTPMTVRDSDMYGIVGMFSTCNWGLLNGWGGFPGERLYTDQSSGAATHIGFADPDGALLRPEMEAAILDDFYASNPNATGAYVEWETSGDVFGANHSRQITWSDIEQVDIPNDPYVYVSHDDGGGYGATNPDLVLEPAEGTDVMPLFFGTRGVVLDNLTANGEPPSYSAGSWVGDEWVGADVLFPLSELQTMWARFIRPPEPGELLLDEALGPITEEPEPMGLDAWFEASSRVAYDDLAGSATRIAGAWVVPARISGGKEESITRWASVNPVYSGVFTPPRYRVAYDTPALEAPGRRVYPRDDVGGARTFPQTKGLGGNRTFGGYV